MITSKSATFHENTNHQHLVIHQFAYFFQRWMVVAQCVQGKG